MTDLTLLDDVLSRAKKKGATAADAVLVRSTSLSVSVRHGKTDVVERSEAAELGLRVFAGQKQAIIATTDFSSRKIDDMVARVLDMAQATPEDPYAGLADPAQLAKIIPELDLADPVEPDPALLAKAAGEVEAAALAVSGITNSEGGDASWSRSDVAIAGTNGMSASYARTSSGISTTVLAGEGTGMQRDYDYDSAVYWSDLRDPAFIGRRAAERTVRALNPRKISSMQVPVVYEAREARDVLGHLLSAINGGTVARGATFLKDRMGELVMAPGLNLVEDPFVKRSGRSRPMDAEGLAPQRRNIIDNGILTTWLLDLRAARKLNLTPTGHGSRGVGGPPGASASNVWLEPGQASVDELIADIKQGLYLTGILGHGTNMVTGDYSRGATGFWIENGKITYPVNELTVAGNLADMFRNITPASDLERRYGVDSPTLRIEGMTIAGQ